MNEITGSIQGIYDPDKLDHIFETAIKDSKKSISYVTKPWSFYELKGVAHIESIKSDIVDDDGVETFDMQFILDEPLKKVRRPLKDIMKDTYRHLKNRFKNESPTNT